MPSTAKLISQLKTDYPQFSFKKSDVFLWSPTEKTICYSDGKSDDYIYILHELSHAILGHIDYGHDIELIAMERQAWDKSTELAVKYDLMIDDNMIQSSIDTYRDWLHSRSTCPMCEATGLQAKKYTYNCLVCGHTWRVNEAKSCALRRYKIQK